MNRSKNSSKSLRSYDHRKVEAKWQKRWEEESVNHPKKMGGAKKPFYNLWMFPYPSAEGLHAGHAFASTGSDVYGRFQRMNGREVFQPIGYDSFGIHGENFAIKRGKHPMDLIKKTTKNYERQLRSLGHGYDWTRIVTTSEPDYYKWTQWLFVQLFKAGLAYRKEAEVNWCPSCKTVLADEQVMTPSQAEKEPKNAKGEKVKDTGDLQVCERCGTIVERKKLAQWFFRITEYADQLLEGLDKIDWPEKIKIAQKNWIGKKVGINISYDIKSTQEKVVCWTSRPDTNFGATFVVVSPEYAQEKLKELIKGERKAKVKKYIKRSLSKSKEKRIEEGRKKTGEFTGLYAVNQLNGYEMPIWIADFVLSDVGTGAVVGVPGHDKRDFEFAKEFDIEIKRVVVGSDKDESDIRKIEQVQEEEGVMVNSEFLDGFDIHEATVKMMDYLEKKGWGKRSTNYHLRDWLISRQRYWGPPIPMIYCKKCSKERKGWHTVQEASFKGLYKKQGDWDHSGWWPVPEKDLPVKLPYLKNFKPKGGGRGPLADSKKFLSVKCPECGSEAEREPDVSDTFLDSAWYFLRYPSTREKDSEKAVFNEVVTKKWLPVNLYFGGAEHAVLHLMYSRFVTKVLSGLGMIDFDEPFPKFYAHGLMIKDGAKMSKSRGNVVNPDEYIEKYGADTLRLYTMFMGPMNGYPDFRDTGIEGMSRFIKRVWELFEVGKEGIILDVKNKKNLLTKLHQTIKKCSEDIEEYKYNTAIASIMGLVNEMRDEILRCASLTQDGKTDDKSISALSNDVWEKSLETLCLLLAPFAPHFAEEVWCEVLGNKFSVHRAKWPKFDPKLITEDKVIIPVQVNGKVRLTIEVENEKSKDKDYVIKIAKQQQSIKKWITSASSVQAGDKVKKEVFIPGKLVNFVVN